MTYQEMYNKYHHDFAKASERLLKLDKELSETKGFGELQSIPEYQTAYKEWQIAGNNYNGFLSQLKGKNINPNDEFTF
jgi:uncharacterized protein YukE